MELKKEKLKKLLSKVKLEDVGEKFKELGGGSIPKPPKVTNKCYPSLFLSGAEISFLKSAKVGEKKTLLVKALVRSKSIWDDARGKKEEYSLEVREVGTIDS